MEPAASPSNLDVLRWIADCGDKPWFPSRHAEEHHVDRQKLDQPLSELRQAEWISVVAWEKGFGQGYGITRVGKERLTPSINTPNSKLGYLEEELPAVASPAILFANLTWFVVGMFVAWRLGVGIEYLKADGHPGAVQMLFKMGAVTGLSILQGDWWRLASCCFVHIGLFHLAINMLTLGMLGPVVEGLWGKRRFALIYAVSGLVGSAVAIALHPMEILAGASGALWGILAAMIAWLLNHRHELRPGIASDWGRKIALVLFINILISFAPGVSMAGHLGGGIAGFATAVCLDWPVDKSRIRKFGGLLGAVLVLLAGVVFLTGSMRYSEKWNATRNKNRIQQLERDRSQMHAALGERIGKVHFRVVNSLAEDAKIPMYFPTPKAVARIRARAEELRLNAEDASNKSQSLSGEIADRYRAYFSTAKVFAETLIREFDKPVPDYEAVQARNHEAEMAWKTAERKSLSPP